MALSSGRITNSNLMNQPYWNLYNLINNRSNVPNPNDSTGNDKFVYTRMPNNFYKKFPFIVLRRVKPSKQNSMADLSKAFHAFDFTLQVFSKDEYSDSSGDPIGANTADLICNNIIKTLEDKNNRLTLNGYGMQNLVYNVDEEDDEIEGKTVFFTEFDIRFENSLISAS